MQINIQSLLQKYKDLRNPREEREKIAGIITKRLGFNVTEDKIVFKDNILSIKVDSYLKTELFIKKESLADDFKKEGYKIVEIK